jgi:hypothetical protein
MAPRNDPGYDRPSFFKGGTSHFPCDYLCQSIKELTTFSYQLKLLAELVGT